MIETFDTFFLHLEKLIKIELISTQAILEWADLIKSINHLLGQVDNHNDFEK